MQITPLYHLFYRAVSGHLGLVTTGHGLHDLLPIWTPFGLIQDAEIFRTFFGGNFQLLADLAHQLLLVIGIEDVKTGRPFQPVDLATEHPEAELMKGHDKMVLQGLSQQRIDTLAHLTGRLVGKGHTENLVR